jgi:asparagine synthase (glutamine-hydrolysing)
VCGIAGQVRTDGRPVSRALIERMCGALEHRGPDARGIHLDHEAGLGIQRLRVIDLETGDQPIYNEDRSVAVVLNGEIYNYLELRRDLRRSGHRFVTDGDTEVIAHLYEEEGAACVRRLHGMFAFAVWDRRARRLLLARDRLGKKPLLYACHAGTLTFASEFAALMHDPEIPRRLDHGALDAYLALRWIPAPFSAFEAVRKLPPASTLVYEAGHARTERYWQLDYAKKLEATDDRELMEGLREQLRRAVRRRMIADVPLGAFLSGGIDSSAVVAAMAESSPEPVRTFSIGFSQEDYDELPKASRIAALFGTDHHELTVEPKAIELLPAIVRHYGEPYADSSAIPSFYLAQMASRRVTVALNGDGGDESFAGYARYVSNLALHNTRALPRFARRALGTLGRGIPSDGRVNSLRSRARRLAGAIALEPAERHGAYLTHLTALDRRSLYTPDYADLLAPSVVSDVLVDRWRRSMAPDPVDRMLDVDVQVYLPDDLLVKMDIATMAYGLEARSPLLDHEFMEFAAALPRRLKLRGTERKVGLRSALRGWVPDEILDAPKRGFCVPLADWFRGELHGFARDVLLDPATRARGYFREARVRELLDRHSCSADDHSQAIWTLLVFELWHRHFVDAEPEAGARG